ncbi:MAG TPA: hypothetical protein VFU90_16255, partial [Candidatus Tumulicola sp.]|nr:hypothetical protein [Candidatus Tumulicola sp.]
VGRDTNGDYDTYEWENGTVYLISSGASAEYSPFLDNSASGNDVFFATTDELVSGDNDGGFDVYDARVPRPGDKPPPAAVPCTGAVCQGPPSAPNLLGVPASAAFGGPGNLTPTPPAAHRKAAGKKRLRNRKLDSALKACARKHSNNRRQCERQARRHYANAKKAATRGRRGNR